MVMTNAFGSLLAVGGLAIFLTSLWHGDGTALRWAPPMMQSTESRDDLGILLSPSAAMECKPGAAITMRCIIEAHSGAWRLNDPFLANGEKSWVILVFFGRKLIATLAPPTTKPSSPFVAWGGMGAGAEFKLLTGPKCENILDGVAAESDPITPLGDCVLGPGEYGIQVIASRGVASIDGTASHPVSRPLRLESEVLLRSKVVRITVLEN